MKLKELKTFLNKLTPAQLEQPFVVFGDDDELAIQPNEIKISEEDIYWEHNVCFGNIEQLKQDFPDDWEDEIQGLNIVPKGTITFETL